MNRMKINQKANLLNITRFPIGLHLKVLERSVPEMRNVLLIYENSSAGNA